MGDIRVVICGMGSVALEAAEILLQKKGIEIVGVVAQKTNVGLDLGKAIGIDRITGIIVSNDLAGVLKKTKPDVVLDGTSSLVHQVFDLLMQIIDSGVHIVSACEQLTNPWLSEPELAKRLDDNAKRMGVSVVATGINPGWYLDQLPYMITGACAKVNKIKLFRVVEGEYLANRSRTVTRNFGLGLDIDVAKQYIKEGKITGHVGLKETIDMLAKAMGGKLTKIIETKEPLPCPEDRNYKLVQIKKGQSYGVKYDGIGLIGDAEVIRLDGIWACDPRKDLDGFEPCYTLWIEGKPNLRVDMQGATGVGHNIITPARCCNWIPHIVKSKPGLQTDMTDHPLIGCLQDK